MFTTKLQKKNILQIVNQSQENINTKHLLVPIANWRFIQILSSKEIIYKSAFFRVISNSPKRAKSKLFFWKLRFYTKKKKNENRQRPTPKTMLVTSKEEELLTKLNKSKFCVARLLPVRTCPFLTPLQLQSFASFYKSPICTPTPQTPHPTPQTPSGLRGLTPKGFRVKGLRGLTPKGFGVKGLRGEGVPRSYPYPSYPTPLNPFTCPFGYPIWGYASTYKASLCNYGCPGCPYPLRLPLHPLTPNPFGVKPLHPLTPKGFGVWGVGFGVWGTYGARARARTCVLPKGVTKGAREGHVHQKSKKGVQQSNLLAKRSFAPVKLYLSFGQRAFPNKSCAVHQRCSTCTIDARANKSYKSMFCSSTSAKLLEPKQVQSFLFLLCKKQNNSKASCFCGAKTRTALLSFCRAKKLICKKSHTQEERYTIKSSNSILLSISGGQDSIFLLFCVSFLKSQLAFKPKLIWCNHFWQKGSFYTALNLTKSAVAFSSPIVGFLPFHISTNTHLYKNVSTRFRLDFFHRGKNLSFASSFTNQTLFFFFKQAELSFTYGCILPLQSKKASLCNLLFTYGTNKNRAYKSTMSPYEVLAFTCPTPQTPHPTRAPSGQRRGEGVKGLRGEGATVLTKLREPTPQTPHPTPQTPHPVGVKGLRGEGVKGLRGEGHVRTGHACTTYRYSFMDKRGVRTYGLASLCKSFGYSFTPSLPVPPTGYKAKLCTRRGTCGVRKGTYTKVVKRELETVAKKESFVRSIRRCVRKNSRKRSFLLNKKKSRNGVSNLCISFMDQIIEYGVTSKYFLRPLLSKKKAKGYKRFVQEISETRARNWRHISTARACTFYGFTLCMYGHTLSDRIETILFNLVRGAGEKALYPLPWKRDISHFSYNSFYPTLKQVRKNTHLNLVL